MTIRGRVPRSNQRTHSRPALVGPALLIAVLAAVLFTASPVNAQSPTVRVYFEEDAYTVAESDDPSTPNVAENEVLVTVRLSRDPQRQVIIPIEKFDDEGASSADYSGVPQNVTFNSGETSKTILFTATHDTVDDDGETVYLGIGSSLPAGVTSDFFGDRTSVTIKDDDRPTSLTVSFDVGMATVDEGETTTIKVRLSEDPEREIVIPITVAGLGGATSDDYSGVPSSVTFGADQCRYYTNEAYTCYETSKSISFMALQDSDDDDGEAVRFSIGSPLPAGVTLGQPAMSTVRISEGNDSGEVVVGTAQVGVSVSARVYFYTSGGRISEEGISNEAWQWQRSATEYGGYSDIPASEGGTSNPYTPSAGDLGMWLKAKVTYDDATDTGLTAQMTTQQPVLWGPVVSNAGFAHYSDRGFVYVLIHPLTQRYAQPFTTGPDPRGYLLVGARLALYESEGTAAGTWEVHADAAGLPAVEPLAAARPIPHIDSADDSFEELTHPDGVHLDPGTRYWIVISQTTPYDDGNIGVGAYNPWGGLFHELGFRELGPDQEEWDPAPVDPGSADGWSVDFQALTYYYDDPDDPSDDPSATCEDNTEEGFEIACEDVLALLPWRLLSHSFKLSQPIVLQMSVLVAPEVTVRFTEDSYTVAEGGTQAVTVELNGDPRRTFTIPITTTDEGGATSTDYSTPSSVRFNAGETSKTFSFTATQDTVDDDDESVKLGFGTMPDVWVSAGTRDETTVNIADDDDPFVTVMYDQSSYTVAEGGTQTVTVTLSADPERTIIIPIEKTDQGGADSADYSGVPSSVTFNAGEMSKPFTFTATQDTVDDDDESVLLEFGMMPDARVSAGAIGEATVSITDDDDPFVTVMFGQSSYTVAEGGTQTVTVTLSADPERTIIIPIEKTDQGGADSADYSGVPSSVTFNAGEMSKPFTFTAAQDEIDDDDESVLLEFGTMPDERVNAGIHAEATVAITDDDDPFVTVMFGQDSQGVGEGETVHVTVRLSADPERTVTISITSTGQSGATTADYSVPASVTFNDGDTEKTIAFMATEDEEDDDDESVKLSFGSGLPDRVSEGTRTETTLNIGDDDDPTVTVTFGQTAYTVDEGATQQVTVTVSADPERTIIIPITTTLQGTASADDYSGVLPSVTFTDGTSQTFTFEATQDLIDDDGESVKLGFGTMPDPRVSAPAMNELTVNINDDDTADIVLSPLDLTMEESDSANYIVALATEPTVYVTVTITGHSGTDLTLSGPTLSNNTLTFTTANWNTPQTVTVAADHDDDGVNDNETLAHTAGGAEYDNVERALPVTVNDDDPLEIVLSPLPLTVEEGDSANYGVGLATEPTVAVTVTITGYAGTDLTLSGPTPTFTAANWNILQTVTVRAAHDDDIDDDHATLTHTSAGGEYDALTKAVPVTVDDNTGNLRLVDGTMTDPGNNDDPSEGRLEVFYNGEWCTICDDYWGHTDDNQDVVCRQLGFVGGSVEDHERFRNSYFPPGTRDQTIALDNVNCRGSESNLLDCPNRGWGVHDCRHFEDVGIRCIQNSAGAYVTNVEFSAPPGANGKYDVGETVEVTLVWSEAVNVDVTPAVPPYTGIHPPHLHLGYGRTAAPSTKAVYTSGTGTTRTVFTATVEDRGSAPYDSLLVLKESLTTEIWNATPGLDPVGSYITSASTGDPATLKHPYHRSAAVGMQAGAATIPGVPTFNDPGEDNVFGPGETVEVTFTFSQPVQVDTTGGTPSVEVLLSGTDAKQARYARGSGTGQLVFGYTLAAGDGEHNSLLVDPNSLRLNGGTIRDVANNLDAATQHQGGGTVFLPPPDETAPQLQSAIVNGSSLTLAYDEELDNADTLSSSLFGVNVNGGSRPVMGVAVVETNVNLLLSPAVAAGDTVTVDYTAPTDAGTAGVQDLSGNAAPSFSGQAVTNDTAPEQPLEPSQTERSPQGELDILGSPTGLQVARHGSGKLVASWIAPDTGPVPTGYTVRWKESGDDWADRNDVSEAHITNGFWDIITGLTDGTEYAVRVIATRDDANSAPSEEVTATPGETTPPELSSASVDGAELTLTYDEPLDTGETPDRSSFPVTVAGSGRGVDTVAVSGSAVTLTLVTAVAAGEAVALDYTAPTGESDSKLKDLAGNAAASFSGQDVTNDTQAAVQLTASAHDVPTAHDGSTTLTFEVRFTETPREGFGYKTLRDHAFTVTGGEVVKARRLEKGKNVRWEISVRPDGNGSVTIVLPATTDCEADGAVCTDDGRVLSNRLEITVPGP